MGIFSFRSKKSVVEPKPAEKPAQPEESAAVPAPYRHVPVHAASDSMTGTPPCSARSSFELRRPSITRPVSYHLSPSSARMYSSTLPRANSSTASSSSSIASMSTAVSSFAVPSSSSTPSSSGSRARPALKPHFTTGNLYPNLDNVVQATTRSSIIDASVPVPPIPAKYSPPSSGSNSPTMRQQQSRLGPSPLSSSVRAGKMPLRPDADQSPSMSTTQFTRPTSKTTIETIATFQSAPSSRRSSVQGSVVQDKAYFSHKTPLPSKQQRSDSAPMLSLPVLAVSPPPEPKTVATSPRSSARRFSFGLFRRKSIKT